MTIPPLTGGGLGIPSQRIPLLTAPVNTGIPPIVGDDKRLPLLPPQAGSGTAAAPGLRDDAPITLGGRLQQGDRLPDTTKLALALESATRALQHGRADVVLMELDAVWSNQLASDSPWYLRTAALQLLGRMSDAEQVIRDGIARLPRSAAILYLLGVHTANRGQVDAARVANDHALSLHPTEPLLWLQRAALTQMGGRHDTVAEILAHVQTLEPSFPASHWLVTLGRLGERAGRPTPAVQRAIERLKIVVPATLLIIFLLLYATFRRFDEAALIMGTLPFALTGGLWLLYWLGYSQSVATGVGFIALAGVSAEFGVVMLIYLKHALAERGLQPDNEAIEAAVREGALLRVRPKAMTVAVILAGLFPILIGAGTGSEVMSRIAAPMMGGMITAPLLSMLIIPAAYLLLSRRRMARVQTS